MPRPGLHRRLSESTLTLPITALLVTLLWWLPEGGYTLRLALGWAVAALTTYTIIEMAAVHALLRIRSRMVSTIYLLLLLAATPLHALCSGTLAALALAVALRCLFDTCHATRPQLPTLHAYLILSLGSLAWPPLLYVALPLLLCQAIFQRTLTRHSAAAALMGLIVPYFLWFTAAFALMRFTPLIEHLQALAAPLTGPIQALRGGQPLWADIHMQWLGVSAADAISTPSSTAWQATIAAAHATDLHGFLLNLKAWTLARPALVAMTLLLLLYALTGILHYLTVSADDKIHVRMSHFTCLVITLLLLLWLILQPHYGRPLVALAALTTAPSMAHYVALSRSRLAPLWVTLLVVGAVAAGLLK